MPQHLCQWLHGDLLAKVRLQAHAYLFNDEHGLHSRRNDLRNLCEQPEFDIRCYTHFLWLLLNPGCPCRFICFLKACQQSVHIRVPAVRRRGRLVQLRISALSCLQLLLREFWATIQSWGHQEWKLGASIGNQPNYKHHRSNIFPWWSKWWRTKWRRKKQRQPIRNVPAYLGRHTWLHLGYYFGILCPKIWPLHCWSNLLLRQCILHNIVCLTSYAQYNVSPSRQWWQPFTANHISAKKGNFLRRETWTGRHSRMGTNTGRICLLYQGGPASKSWVSKCVNKWGWWQLQ